jgi:hypothetical protein
MLMDAHNSCIVHKCTQDVYFYILATTQNSTCMYSFLRIFSFFPSIYSMYIVIFIFLVGELVTLYYIMYPRLWTSRPDLTECNYTVLVVLVQL